MNHCLASFALEPERPALALSQFMRAHGERWLHSNAREREQLTRELTTAMRDALRPQQAPDLLHVLPNRDPDRPWLQATAAVLTSLRSRQDLHLVECQRRTGPEGCIALAVVDRTLTKPVRKDDCVSAGFAAMRQEGSAPMVWPRIYRKVCTNGAILYAGDGEQHEVTAETLPDAVLACLSGSNFDPAVERMRRAAEFEIPDPALVLTRARPIAPPAEIIAEFRRAGDRTGWGLLNAATALARAELVLPRRLHREQDAERILRAVESMARPGAPARSLQGAAGVP
jgi:hypothetical protein